MTQEQQPQPDQTRAEQTNIMIRMVVVVAVIAGLALWYQGSKPDANDPYASCWTFIVGMDARCQADLAASALSGRGHVHSKEYLNGYE